MAMKLQFKKQKFQEDAAMAVVNVFEGQPKKSCEYLVDPGSGQLKIGEKKVRIGWGNYPIVITEGSILEHIRSIQRDNLIEPSKELVGKYNLTIEMETGVGKTYTYIKTIYELNKKYGWSKFIIVVPSVAIREGVKKSFEITKEHFNEMYDEELISFVYNSSNLSELKAFESDSKIRVMIINSQAFNAKTKTSKAGRRIYMKLDEFNSRKPIDAIAKTNPILIIDEPQSVEGEKTKDSLKDFNPLFTLRYSATPKEEHNLIYRLDALDAYNKKLVKKIAVKGIEEKGDSASDAYVYFEKLNLSDSKSPTATVHHYYKGGNKILERVSIVKEGDDLYAKSDKIEAYKNGYVVTGIDARDGIKSLTFGANLTLYEGDVIGKPDEEIKRRIQIHETIKTHLKKEMELYNKGIKVLSLFFIDEVDKYKPYVNGKPSKGIYAEIFEEEYKNILNYPELALDSMSMESNYVKYLNGIKPEETHAGYFAVDKKGQATNNTSKEVSSKDERDKSELDAYDLIMKNKEALLSFETPVRFIFSHTALREGWDNPNVFQICTLKQSNSNIRKRQEVGRGMRLCVNQQGIRMDESTCDGRVHDINVLTVVASESYDKFSRELQDEIKEAVADRPLEVTADLFEGKTIVNAAGDKLTIDKRTALLITEDLVKNGYVEGGVLTDKFYADKENGSLAISSKFVEYKDDIVNILDTVYKNPEIINANSRKRVELRFSEEKYKKEEFQELWNRINKQTVYHVDFNTEELIQKAVQNINKNLTVSKTTFEIVEGEMENIASKQALAEGSSIVKSTNKSRTVSMSEFFSNKTKYDLIGKVADATNLTRKTAADILMKIDKEQFDKFKINPEEFIIKVSNKIREEEATAIVEHIKYNLIDRQHEKEIFTDNTLKGFLGSNAMKADKHLYNYVVYDSENERKFAEQLEAHEEVIVYVKLPRGFKIPTPLGDYNPDWAIAYKQGNTNHIYFVAETKGSMSSLELRSIEKGKIDCAKEFFKTISGDSVTYSQVDSYSEMIDIINNLEKN